MSLRQKAYNLMKDFQRNPMKDLVLAINKASEWSRIKY